MKASDKYTEDMESRRKPLFIILVIIALVLALESIISNIYTLTILESSWNAVLPIISMFTFLFAIYYIVVGSKKESSAFFKSFLVMYCVIMIATVLCIISNVSLTGELDDAVITALINIITYGFLFILLIVPDLGRTRSFTYAIFVTILQFFEAICFICVNTGLYFGGSTVNTVENITMKSNFTLSLILLILIYAKYEDKSRRKSVEALDTKCEIREHDGAIVYEEMRS